MLQYLKIDNLALVESAELEFSAGFNVMTGESGAGKSVILGGIALLLGERCDANSIRSGAARAELSASFMIPERLRPRIAVLLAAADVDDCGGELNLRRVITPSGSRSYVNGGSVSLKTLHDIAALLVDMQKCDEQLSLGNCARQLELLDRYGALEPELAACAAAAARVSELEMEKAQFIAALPSDAEIELAGALADAVAKVNPAPGEDVELAARHDRTAAAHEILQLAQALASRLSEGEDSLADRMSEVNRELSALCRLDASGAGELAEAGERVSENIRELSAAVATYASGIELDGEAFAAIEARLSSIYTLKRRYGPTLEQVLEKAAAAEEALARRVAAAGKLRDYDEAVAAARVRLSEACAFLGAKRRQAAAGLCAALAGPLRNVGFAKGRFDISFAAAELSARGGDAIDMMFSANAGEELRPLRLIASSGERSRLFLALKTVLADADEMPTAVFDEIDVNIGGETANKVGAMLRELGRKRQIICISHLVQVAAGADRHFAVVKLEKGGRTLSEAHELPVEAVVHELARMLGGGAAALEHASVLSKAILRKNDKD